MSTLDVVAASSPPQPRKSHQPRHPALTTYVVAGVSGSGKSTVGQLLAQRIGSRFFDGDDFHTESNKEKMRAGIPLTDEDRMPWLAQLALAIQQHASSDKPTVFACSALKRKYRDVLAARAASGDPAHVLFVILKPPRAVLEARLAERWKLGGHFMPPTLLDSQLAALEVEPLPSHLHSNASALPEPAPLFVLEDTEAPPILVDRILQHAAALAAAAAAHMDGS